MAGDRCLISMGVLNNCDVENLPKVLHGMVDGICGIGCLRYEDYSKTWALEEWWDLNDRCKAFIKQAVKNAMTKDEIMENMGALSDKCKQTMVEVLQARTEEIRQLLKSNTHQISKSTLSDFDWQVKLAMSSDKLSTVQDCLITVDLDVRQEKGSNPVSIEMGKAELKSLISTLEAANTAVQNLKS